MFRILLPLLIGIFLFSCGEDVVMTESPDPVDSMLLLKEYRRDGQLLTTFTYNVDKTLSTSTSYSLDGEPKVISNYTYTENEIIIWGIFASSGNVNFKNVLTSVNDSLVTFEVYAEGTEFVSTAYKYFNNNSCGQYRNTVRNADETIIYNATTEYIDSNCSSIIRRLDGSNPGVEYIYEENIHNDKYNPLNSTRMPFERVEKYFNILEHKSYHFSGALNNLYSYVAEMEYNEFNFPVIETRTYGNGSAVIYTYEYY